MKRDLKIIIQGTTDAGKTTLAHLIQVLLLEHGIRVDMFEVEDLNYPLSVKEMAQVLHDHADIRISELQQFSKTSKFINL